MSWHPRCVSIEWLHNEAGDAAAAAWHQGNLAIKEVSQHGSRKVLLFFAAGICDPEVEALMARMTHCVQARTE